MATENSNCEKTNAKAPSHSALAYMNKKINTIKINLPGVVFKPLILNMYILSSVQLENSLEPVESSDRPE